MKLSEIVAYINLLDSMSVDAECREALRILDGVLNVVTSYPIQLDSYSRNLGKNFTSISSGVKDFSDTLADLRLRLSRLIEEQEPQYFSESKRWFDQESIYETNEYVLNRRLGIDDESNILIRSHLRSFSDWRIPGMVLGPGRETFIEDLVPMDPLYVVDQHIELIDPAVEKFTPEYQQRLRKYVINDHSDAPIFTQLPQNQFGLIFAYNYFNYRPIEVIRRYFKEIFLLLRPGGTLLMTYNNCDRAQGVGLVEHSFMCYTPLSHLCRSAEDIGFEFTFNHNGQGDLSWAEFHKPGDITSLRGGQTLAKIVAKTD
jgi:SAM-dependent methyltransferase